MYFGKYFFDIKIYDSYSLKDKRRVTKSIIARLQEKFKLSVCQCDKGKVYNFLKISCAITTSDYRLIEKIYQDTYKFIEENYNVEICYSNYEEY